MEYYINITVPLRIDFDLLRKQKLELLALASHNPELVEGLLALIDTIQDWAVDHEGVPETMVFPNLSKE